jgi:hypothetical protein
MELRWTIITEKKWLHRPRGGWEDNIKTYVIEIAYEGVF